MVYVTRSLLYKFFRPRERPEAMSFLDTLQVVARSGRGGNGSKQLGGIGGRGGHVILVGAEGGDLSMVKRQNTKCIFKATSGGDSNRNQLLGIQGNDCIIRVPLGVRAKDTHERLLGEINEEGAKVVIARGGNGGSPVTNFLGLPGETNQIKLDLQLMADVGLLGFPNAGKSSLLQACSQAKPRIASYPFTTLRPKLGIIHYEDERRISMADLPGLIEGAHRNEGMGHRFLRHLERTKLILLLVDICGFQLNVHLPHRTVLETIALLNREVELFNPDLLLKPIVLVVNKMDLPEAPEFFAQLQRDLENLPESFSKLQEFMIPESTFEFRDVCSISANGGKPAVVGLCNRIREIMDEIYVEEENFAAEDEARMEKLKRLMKQSGPDLR